MSYPPIEVHWNDAQAETGWINPDQVPGLAPIRTRGWLVKDAVDHIVVCLNAAEDGDLGDCIAIPKAWIKEDDRDTQDSLQPQPTPEAIHREPSKGGFILLTDG